MVFPASSTKFLVYEDQQVLVDLPAGKPSPYIPLTSLTDDHRPRVKQKAQGERNCWYYAMKRIIPRYGKYTLPLSGSEKGREVEVIFSRHEKKLEKIHLSFEEMLRIMRGALSHKLLNAQTVAFCQIMAASSFPEIKSFFADAVPVLEDLVQQKEGTSVNQYLAARQVEAQAKAYEELFNALKVDIKQVYKDYRQIQMWPSKPWEELSVEGKKNIMHNLVIQIAAKQFGLMESTWHPSQTNQELIAEIKKRGPLVIFGHFGRAYHKQEPFKLKETFGGKSIYGWRPNPEPIGKQNSHAAVIIGAKDQVIYFLDPLDASDPEDPETPRVYVMSYKGMQSKIVNICAEKLWAEKASGHEPIFSDKIKYAVYYPMPQA